MRCEIATGWVWLLILLSQSGVLHAMNQSGYHCAQVLNRSWSGSLDKISGQNHCVECFFPENCVASNNCKEGSTGSTCEKCATGYYRIGSLCLQCPAVPWSSVSLSIFLLASVLAVYMHGLTHSLCTKLKLLCSFLQIVLLTFHTKIAWPSFLIEMFGLTNFAAFSTNVFLPDCVVTDLPEMSSYYMEWFSSMCIPLLVLCCGKVVDRSIGKAQQKNKGMLSEASMRHLEKKLTVRRLVVMVLLVMYMPATLSCIRTFLCSGIVPEIFILDETKDVFLLNNNVSCGVFLFQTIHFLAIPYLLIMGVLMPMMLILFTLRQRKWKLLYTQWFLYSPVYEAIKDKFCFWEAIPLLRKLVTIIITELYPVSGFVQILVQLGMTAGYLVAVLLLRPFRSCYWVHKAINVHMVFEVASTLVVGLLQLIGLSVVTHHYVPYSDIVGVTFIFATVALWLILVLAITCETKMEIGLSQVEVQEARQPQSSVREKQDGRKFWQKRRVGPDPEYLEKININKKKLNF